MPDFYTHTNTHHTSLSLSLLPVHKIQSFPFFISQILLVTTTVSFWKVQSQSLMLIGTAWSELEEYKMEENMISKSGKIDTTLFD